MKRPVILLLCLLTCVLLAETIGVRPYEMDWAGRYQDEHPEAVIEDFENEGWFGECADGEITVERSREQLLFGDYVLKVAYHNNAEGTQVYYIRPPEPLATPEGFDAITLWAYGNEEAICQDALTIGRVIIYLQLRNAEGETKDIEMYRADWYQWCMMHHTMTPEELAQFSRPGTVVTGIVLKPANNTELRTIYFDSLSFFKEQYKPLTFTKRPKRGIPLFPGQDPGANTGEGTLPFPTREDTILPDSAGNNAQISINKENNAFILHYVADDGDLKIAYTPQTGTWSDFTASWNGGPSFQPLYDGGAKFLGDGATAAELVSCGVEDGKVKAVWNYTLADGHEHEVTYQFCLKGKTLVLDTISSNADNQLLEVSYGEVKGVECLDLVQIPYYAYRPNVRPAVPLVKVGDDQLFLSGHTDWYLSNSSRPLAGEYPYETKLQFNGSTRYNAKIDGKRNDVYDRFFVTVSPVFEEHLPNIANPQSPWRHITGTYIWGAYGAWQRDKDKEHWYYYWRHGMRKCLVTNHETMWRDGEESFTFRTRTAPGKGGDEGEWDYARYLQDTLGFVYGPYNNFTDLAPVNEHWSIDMVTRDPDNIVLHSWRRCYQPKALRAVEFCEKLAPAIQAKFHYSTAYCDVHTAIGPWDGTDFDFRTPGAGTFAQTFYAYGELMLLQKKAWNGPVYSEGPYYCFYSGLTDGNYGQDRSYLIYSRPWLVDFDLRKIHEKECNFGMGAVDMFFRDEIKGDWREDGHTDEHIDRFFTAVMAFGHPGVQVKEVGTRTAMRNYFLFQQMQTQYTQASVTAIRYCTEDGRLLDTSEAIRTGAYRNSQLVIDYDSGAHVVANGSTELPLKVTYAGREISLRPNSFVAWTDDGQYLSTNADSDGLPCDYVESPEYIFLDGRDRAFQRMPKADGSGSAVCRNDDAEHWEFIHYEGAQCGFAVEGGNARAYNYENEDIGPATAVRCRGMLYVLPVEGAFSYKLEKSAVTPETLLSSEAYEVASGDTVTIQTPNGPVERVINGDPGERVWVEIDGQYLCFVVRMPVESE